MLTLQPKDGLEKFLCDRAFDTRTPISGTFELLPICNMDCKMCYIRISKKEMLKQGHPLSVEQWLKIGKQAVDMGTMFLLLTGGEPFLYPDFTKLYLELRQLGIHITINTNGTLINKEIVSLFQQDMPRRINISLYGSNDKVYADLCRNPKGFTQTMSGIRLLLDAGIPVKLNYTLTSQNQHELDAIMKISDELGVPISVPTYMFPPARKPNDFSRNSFQRLSPSEMAAAQFEVLYKNFYKDADYINGIEDLINSIQEKDTTTLIQKPPGGFLCSAGVSNYWVNWKGELMACGMLNNPHSSLLEHDFSSAWNLLYQDTQKILTSSKCFNCRYRKICHTCAASAFTETGSFTNEVSYHCEFCETYEQLLKKHLQKLKQ